MVISTYRASIFFKGWSKSTNNQSEPGIQPIFKTSGCKPYFHNVNLIKFRCNLNDGPFRKVINNVFTGES
jgi:hypothetical protein